MTRFYAAHVMILPMLLVALIGIHLFLVVWQGVSVPPDLWDSTIARLRGPRRPVNAPAIAVEYHAVYDDFKARGRSFFPDLIVEDTAAITAVVRSGRGMMPAFGPTR